MTRPKSDPTPTDVPDLPALDRTDDDPDRWAGELVAAEHDLDPATFPTEPEDRLL